MSSNQYLPSVASKLRDLGTLLVESQSPPTNASEITAAIARLDSTATPNEACTIQKDNLIYVLNRRVAIGDACLHLLERILNIQTS